MFRSITLSLAAFGCMLTGGTMMPNSTRAFEPNYDESKIPSFELPDPLKFNDGSTVKTAKQWTQQRRGELLKLFQEHVYGIAPPACPIRSERVSRKIVFDGAASREEVDVFFQQGDKSLSMRLLMYVPQVDSRTVPAFMGLNFQGNHSVDADPDIELSDGWFRNKANTDGNRTTDRARGAAASRWPAEMIVKRGYALVTIYYGDIDPDFDDGFENGIHGLLGKNPDGVAPDASWGSIAAWAYGLSRALDYLGSEDCPVIDAKRVAVFGHSRLGKTSLWTGASDPRFALVISNNSGCGGAALSRRAFGETVERINTSFPHWFCDRFTEYNLNENACPVDQHQLISLIAPRPVYVASATQDRWADPKGELLSAIHAEPVYRLLGTNGFGGETPKNLPLPNQAIKTGTIGYHLRDGKHDVTDYDWQQYLDFADIHLQ